MPIWQPIPRWTKQSMEMILPWINLELCKDTRKSYQLWSPRSLIRCCLGIWHSNVVDSCSASLWNTPINGKRASSTWTLKSSRKQRQKRFWMLSVFVNLSTRMTSSSWNIWKGWGSRAMFNSWLSQDIKRKRKQATQNSRIFFASNTRVKKEF